MLSIYVLGKQLYLFKKKSKFQSKNLQAHFNGMGTTLACLSAISLCWVACSLGLAFGLFFS